MQSTFKYNWIINPIKLLLILLKRTKTKVYIEISNLSESYLYITYYEQDKLHKV